MLSEKYRSSIHTPLLHKTLMRGSFLAGIGALILLAGTFLPPEKLKIWGPFLFLFSLSLIGWGLIPYRRLKRLETEPHEILLSEDQLIFCWRRKPVFTVKLNKIQKAAFVEKGDVYGIAIHLNKPATLLDEAFDLPRFQRQSQKKYGCDLFLPYFSKRTFERLTFFF